MRHQDRILRREALSHLDWKAGQRSRDAAQQTFAQLKAAQDIPRTVASDASKNLPDVPPVAKGTGKKV